MIEHRSNSRMRAKRITALFDHDLNIFLIIEPWISYAFLLLDLGS